MKKLLLIVASLIAVAGMAFGQNYVDVAPGDGTLSAALAAANDGDVFRLIPGAEYTESVNKTIGTIAEKSIAIVADGDGSIKPIVKILTDPAEGTCQFFNVGNNGSLLLAGIEFDGAVDGVAMVSYLLRAYMGEMPQPAFIKMMQLESCVIKNLKSNVVDGAASNLQNNNVIVDSTIINNCIVHDTGSLVQFKYAGSNYIQVTNSTIYNINSYGFRISGPGNTNLPDNTPEVMINHTTWYNLGLKDPREILLSDYGGTSYFQRPWTVVNSIFSTMTNYETSGRIAINIKETLNDNMATITNICMWELNPKKGWRKHTVADTIRMDPGFADPVNGDFTIPAGSLLLTYGNDGGPIGDKRWTNNASAVEQPGLLPEGFILAQNYPNPFNPATAITFTLPAAQTVRLAVYDARGREVALLASGQFSAGSHRIDYTAHGLSSGLYFYKLTAAGQSWTKKMALVQ